MTVYVYEDSDNNVIEVFDSVEKAKDYLVEQWGHEPEWEGDDDNGWHDVVSDYVYIHKKEIR